MRYLLPKIRYLYALALLVVIVLCFYKLAHRNGFRVSAQVDAYSAQLVSTNGGMAPYGTAMQSATSQSDSIQAVNNFNVYVQSRSGWGISSTLASRLGSADWIARSRGAASITSQQLADAINHLIATKLATMSPDQQVALYNQMTLEYLPNGTTYSPNSGFDGVTVTQNADGSFAVTVSGTVFSNRKTLFQQKSPGMVSGGSSFYPAEAELVIYSVAAGDMGWSNDTLATIKSNIASATGLDMSTRSLFGNQGYLARRPLGQFGDETAMAQLFSDLGF